MGRVLGSKKDREELTAALRDADDAPEMSENDARYEASQKRIRAAEAKLPPLGKLVARDRSR
jgi:hypothetical protein